MKKLLFIALCFATVSVSAQSFKVNGYANYVFDDKVDSYYSDGPYFDGTIKGGFQWGIGLQYNPHPYYGIEITYYNQATNAAARYRGSAGGPEVQNGVFDVNVSYLMLNGVRELRKPDSKFEAFGGLGLGAAFINTENRTAGVNGNSKSTTKFAWQLRGGGTIWASEKVGIKLNVQLQSAVQSVGGGFYIGTGGSGAGLSSYSSLLQFGLGGGIVFKLSDANATTAQPRPSAATPEKTENVKF